MTGESPICIKCKHFNYKDFNGLTCLAFPEGIPDEILLNGNNHSKPLPEQDNDIIFEEAIEE